MLKTGVAVNQEEYVHFSQRDVVPSWLLCLHKVYFINVEKLLPSSKNVLVLANTPTLFAMNLICYYLDKYLI